MAKFRRRMRPLLGTYVEIGVEDSRNADVLIEKAFREIEDVEGRLNRHNPQSELSRLNRASGEWVEMSSLSVRVLRRARWMVAKSDGRFNCGNMALSAPDIEISGFNVRLRPGLTLTLDGIAKGFAVDLAIQKLKKKGVTACWINAGGDLRVYGAVEIPIWRREMDGRMRLISSLRNSALATSQGPHDDPSFSGQIRGFSGHVASPGVFSVLAECAWLADALTKVACVSHKTERAAVVERLGGWLVPGNAS